MLHPGFRIDIQAVNEHGDPTLRTLLQSVEVLAVGGTENGRPVVNVLTTPAQAETLAWLIPPAVCGWFYAIPPTTAATRKGTLPASTLFHPAPGAKAPVLDKISTLVSSR